MTRVLIVEDSEPLVTALTALIESHGCFEVVGAARTADEALALARRERPDVVTMDLGLRSGTGLDATRAIKAELPATRVVVVTLHEGKTIREAARAAGADAFLNKDALAEKLVELLVSPDDEAKGTH